MSMSNLALTSEELESLILLPPSDSTALLSRLPLNRQQTILRQLGAAAGCRLKPELRKLPLTPTPRQADFLNLTCREALYGGAAGGGKSEALLMWLAEGCEIPRYSGIIFRRIEDDLTNSNDSLVAKAMRMFSPLDAVPSDSGKCWRFPSGAIVQLAGLNHEQSVMKHQGPSYHRIAFDELTHFTQSQYEFLVLSRIRSEPNFPIYKGARGASNPGSTGHAWVRDRFITQEALDTLRALRSDEPCPPGLSFFTSKGHGFVPARLADNPYIDQDEYRAQMSGFTDPVMRERMLNGDWSVMPNTKISPDWIREYSLRGEMICLEDADGKQRAVFHQNDCRRFITVDTAGSTKHITREARGKPHSWSVAGVWDYKHLGTMEALILRHVWRGRVEFVAMCDRLRELNREWRPSRIRVEDATMGPDLLSVLRGELPIDLISTGGKGKVERATKLLNMLAKGQVFLPKAETGWRHPLEAEWFSWQGLEDETNDQVDMAAYAAIECGGGVNGVVTLAVDPRGAGPLIGRGW